VEQGPAFAEIREVAFDDRATECEAYGNQRGSVSRMGALPRRGGLGHLLRGRRGLVDGGRENEEELSGIERSSIVERSEGNVRELRQAGFRSLESERARAQTEKLRQDRERSHPTERETAARFFLRGRSREKGSGGGRLTANDGASLEDESALYLGALDRKDSRLLRVRHHLKDVQEGHVLDLA